MAFGVLISHALVKIQNCYLNETLKNVDRLCMQTIQPVTSRAFKWVFFSATDSNTFSDLHVTQLYLYSAVLFAP